MPGIFLLAGFLTLSVSVTPPVAADQSPARRTSGSDAQDGQFDHFRIPAGTPLLLKLRTPFSSASSKVDDQVEAVLWSPVIQDGVELLPVGSVVIGKITAVVRSSKRTPLGSVSFVFSLIQHAGTKDRAAVPSQRITLEAPSPVARNGRGPGRPKPAEAAMDEGASLVAITAEPLIVRIPK